MFWSRKKNLQLGTKQRNIFKSIFCFSMSKVQRHAAAQSPCRMVFCSSLGPATTARDSGDTSAMGHGRVWSARESTRRSWDLWFSQVAYQTHKPHGLTWRAFRDGKCGLEGPDIPVFVYLIELGRAPAGCGGFGEEEKHLLCTCQVTVDPAGSYLWSIEQTTAPVY